MQLKKFILLYVYEEHWNNEDTDFVFVNDDAIAEVRELIKKYMIKNKLWLDSKNKNADIICDDLVLDYDEYDQNKDKILDYVVNYYGSIIYGDLVIEVKRKDEI